MDWREQYENCHDCAEFTDSEIATEHCKICVCFGCKEDRSKCLTNRYCVRDDEEIILE